MEMPQLKTVGSRELKTRLGTYLRQVRAGVTFMVTDRNWPVAELRPLEAGAERIEDRLRKLAALGVVTGTVAERPPLEPFEPIENRAGSVTEAVTEDRKDVADFPGSV